MDRAYVSISAHEIGAASGAEILGQLAHKLPFAIEPAQRAAWEYQIGHLRTLAAELPSAHFFMEFLIPRMGRRADLNVLQNGIIFVVEYKLGAHRFDRSSMDQVYGYGLDLKHFHETSHKPRIVPILVATEAPGGLEQSFMRSPLTPPRMKKSPYSMRLSVRGTSIKLRSSCSKSVGSPDFRCRSPSSCSASWIVT